MGLLAIVVISIFSSQLREVRDGGSERQPPATPAARLAQSSGARANAEETLSRAFDTRREAFWIEASGRVVRVLPDDREGSRHQRIIVALATGQTLLIAHNIDIAPRLKSLVPGDRLRFRGKYVWNAQGGVIHWTHHDPSGARVGGWLELDGRRYR